MQSLKLALFLFKYHLLTLCADPSEYEQRYRDHLLSVRTHELTIVDSMQNFCAICLALLNGERFLQIYFSKVPTTL